MGEVTKGLGSESEVGEVTNARRNPLLPTRHPQRDLFVCDIVDADPKGDMGSMEHPIFSLSTKPDLRPREYQRGDNFIKISPSANGLATVFDRDVLIYCISQCVAALNEGKSVSRKMRFKAYDLLVATNRQTSGRGYELLKDAFRRLQGTQIETSIKQGGHEHFKVFGLIESAEIVRETREGRMLDVEITLSDWVFDAIENKHVLTLDRRYFSLRKPLERRLYELARKHVNDKAKWKISLKVLHEKCGSGSTMKEFRRLVSKIISDDESWDHMPSYRFEIRGDMVHIFSKNETPSLPFGPKLQIDPDVRLEAKRLASGWDIDVLENEWRGWVHTKKIDVRDPDKHFLAFCRKRGPWKPGK
ncbi:MAG: replication initiator protein A [Pseudomonadota bacterium]